MQLQNLTNNFLGRDFWYFEKIDSTQTEILRRIKDGTIKNGTLILSEIQTNGIGTNGRKWKTSEKNNIAFSFFIETNCYAKKLEGITIEVAQTCLDVFKKIYNIELNIKYPNDIVYNGKKIGGILVRK